MKIDRYLIVCKKPNQKAQTRLSVNYPSLDVYEIAIKLSVDVPDSLFRKPALQASIKVPDEAVSLAKVDCDVADNIKALVSEKLGIELNITGGG